MSYFVLLLPVLSVRPVSNKWIAQALRTDGHGELFQCISTIPPIPNP